MSLPSPLSVGDALLLAKLAVDVSKSFKSAPSEFAEVQSLLWSTSEALKMLDRSIPKDRKTDDPNAAITDANLIVMDIMTNCGGVLVHLEEFVEKYSALDQATGERRWKDEVKRNWRRLTWTKEGGDLSKLKQTLIAHTNALNLSATVLNSGEQKRLQGKVDDILVMLDEIHTWFADNLRGKRSEASPTPTTFQGEGPNKPDTIPGGQNISLRVFASRQALSTTIVEDGSDKVLLCPTATFQDHAPFAARDPSEVQEVFACRCSRQADHSTLLKCFLAPAAHLTRVLSTSGNRSWELLVWLQVAKRLVLLTLEDTSPAYIAKLHHWGERLAMSYSTEFARMYLLSTHIVTADSISILNTKVDVSSFGSQLLGVVFSVKGQNFTVNGPEGVQILHYTSISADLWNSGPTVEPTSDSAPFLHQPWANIIFQVKEPQGVMSANGTDSKKGRYTIQITRDSEASIDAMKGVRFACIGHATCIHEDTSGHSAVKTSISCEKVEFEFSHDKAATHFIDGVNAMREEFRIHYFQFPVLGEQIVYERPLGDVMIRSLYLENARLRVIFDPIPSKYRMIVLRQDHSASVCFELPTNFLDQLTSESPNLRDDGPGWFVEVDQQRTKVSKGTTGVNPLRLGRHVFRHTPSPGRANALGGTGAVESEAGSS